MSIDPIESEQCEVCITETALYECSCCVAKYCGPCAADTDWLCPDCDKEELEEYRA